MHVVLVYYGLNDWLDHHQIALSSYRLSRPRDHPLWFSGMEKEQRVRRINSTDYGDIVHSCSLCCRICGAWLRLRLTGCVNTAQW